MPFGAKNVLVCMWVVFLLTIGVATFSRTAEAQEARLDPFTLFKQTLKEENGRYLFKGYWLAEDALHAEWTKVLDPHRTKKSSGADDASTTVSPLPHPDLSLNINTVNGQLDYWSRPEDRILTYAIDRTAFTPHQYSLLRKDMKEAASDWEQACPHCGIRFVHQPEWDAAPDADKVRFIVRYDAIDPSGTIARSFFPSSAKEMRQIVVTPLFFSNEHEFSRAGMLRHQLGHALGYRHAHISPLAGPDCPREDRSFLGAKYDPNSVMHYMCGGGGTKEMKLSPLDIASHQLLYGFATVQVDIEGKQILKTAAQILGKLRSQYTRLPFRSYDLGSPAGCREYVKDLGLLDAMTSQQTTMNAGCIDFVSLRQVDRGKAQFPVLPFRSYRDVASGSFHEGNSRARIHFEALRNRVHPIRAELVPNAGGDKELLNYIIEWQRFRANIPVSKLEAQKVWAALNTVALGTPGVSISIDDSIAVAETTFPPRYSLKARHPINYRDDICLKPDTAGHYAMLQVKQHEFGTENPPQLSCDFPDALDVLCKDCGAVASCSTEACRNCKTCNHYRPRLFVVDESLDLAALRPPPSPISGAICPWASYQRKHHGTLMAQIMAGANKFFGFMPEVDPELIPDTQYQAKFDDDVLHAYDGEEIAIALLTSQLCYSPLELKKYSPAQAVSRCEISGDVKVTNAADRAHLLVRHRPTQRILSAGNWLWAAAIGQPDGAKKEIGPPTPTTFNADSIASPMVLAESPNVILVSACEKCSLDRTALSERRLWSRAHRGIGNFRSHVMAPGGVDHLEAKSGELIGGIPGFGVGNEPMRTYGTSQAAAYVAGLAAKMLSCYPRHYKSTGQLKEALQFTSMPAAPDTDGQYIATGLVDVKAALRHPHYIYLQVAAEGEGQHDRISPTDFGWCSKTVQFEKSDGSLALFDVEKIRRIVKIADAPGRWIVYERRPASFGIVISSGPFVGTHAPADVEHPLLLARSQKIKLSDIADLQLFSYPKKKVDCSP